MKMVNQARVGASLAGSVDFDEFTAARGRIGQMAGELGN
jgi:hypothetical protein